MNESKAKLNSPQWAKWRASGAVVDSLKENLGKHDSGITVTDRIKNAGIYLEVSPDEIACEVRRFATAGNVEGLRTMFDAYLSWELRGAKKGRTVDQTKTLAMKNFDFVARTADTFDATVEDIHLALAIAAFDEGGKKTVGSITRFYREAVGYNPLNHASRLS